MSRRLALDDDGEIAGDPTSTHRPAAKRSHGELVDGSDATMRSIGAMDSLPRASAEDPDLVAEGGEPRLRERVKSLGQEAAVSRR